MIFLYKWLEDNYTGQIKGKVPNLYLGDTRLEWTMGYPGMLFHLFPHILRYLEIDLDLNLCTWRVL
jgi:hypothetical protein